MTRDYCGNVIYRDGALERVQGDYGYMDSTGNYHYYIKDYQGNVRAVIDRSCEVDNRGSDPSVNLRCLWCFLMVFDGLWWQMLSIKAVKSRQTSSNMFFDGLWWFLMAFGGRCFPSKPSKAVKLHQIFFWWPLVVFGGLWWQMFSIKTVKSRQTSSNIFFDGLYHGLMFPADCGTPDITLQL